jgi:hypothetical protein
MHRLPVGVDRVLIQDNSKEIIMATKRRTALSPKPKSVWKASHPRSIAATARRTLKKRK